MKNKKFSVGLFLLASFGFLSFTNLTKPVNYKALVDKSEVVWIGNKVGGSHTGNVQLKDGNFEVADGLITSGTFVIDMTTISVADNDSKKLYNHLIGADFFNVEKYPTSTLVITGSKKEGEGQIVSGNLTIMDKTNPVSFNVAKIGKSESFMIYTANIKVDRTKYGVIYKSSAIGDNFISDIIEFKVKITGEKLST